MRIRVGIVHNDIHINDIKIYIIFFYMFIKIKKSVNKIKYDIEFFKRCYR